MILFETASGSAYELDCSMNIRRVSGTSKPQPRQGKDGEWKPYRSISRISVGGILCPEDRIRA